jgi:hypothetical protein
MRAFRKPDGSILAGPTLPDGSPAFEVPEGSVEISEAEYEAALSTVLTDPAAGVWFARAAAIGRYLGDLIEALPDGGNPKLAAIKAKWAEIKAAYPLPS